MIVRGVLQGLAIMVLALPAFAHARMERAAPPAGAHIAAAPPELSITFTEGVEAAFSTIELRSEGGAQVATGKPYNLAGNKRQIGIKLPRLPPGVYTVIWHATSVDTHKTEGSFSFTVTE